MKLFTSTGWRMTAANLVLPIKPSPESKTKTWLIFIATFNIFLLCLFSLILLLYAHDWSLHWLLATPANYYWDHEPHKLYYKHLKSSKAKSWLLVSFLKSPSDVQHWEINSWQGSITGLGEDKPFPLWPFRNDCSLLSYECPQERAAPATGTSEDLPWHCWVTTAITKSRQRLSLQLNTWLHVSHP